MRRALGGILAFVLIFALVGCGEAPEAQDDSMVNAYLDAAQKHIDSGDLDMALAVLEEGAAQTGNNQEITEKLEQVKEQKAQQEATEATEDTGTTEATEDTGTTEATQTTEATEATEATTAPTEPAQTGPLVSNYPLQIDMEDMLSANILGMTFYSAYEGGSLDSWMGLYVNGGSDPEIRYEAYWFDEELMQMTYYGILYQQAVDAGWGDIWLDMVSTDAQHSTNW